MLTFTIPESQLVAWLQQLSPEAKYTVLRVLIPTLDEGETLVAYGMARARAVARERGLVWDALDANQREKLVDDVLHEA